MSSDVRALEARLTLTFDADKAVAGLGDVEKRLALLQSAVGTLGIAQVGSMAWSAAERVWSAMEARFARARDLSLMYSPDAAQAGADRTVAELHRDIALGQASGGTVSRYERDMAALAEHQATRAQDKARISDAMGAALTTASATWDALENTAANFSWKDLAVPGRLPARFSEEWTRSNFASLGGGQDLPPTEVTLSVLTDSLAEVARRLQEILTGSQQGGGG